ncbi:hypothetical protein [Devosia sp. 2618]|uniref:hypothetical protein n=1 Tax=Devosia sp. 2618 TaxID=3156454 RepID=UPI0033949566
MIITTLPGSAKLTDALLFADAFPELIDPAIVTARDDFTQAAGVLNGKRSLAVNGNAAKVWSSGTTPSNVSVQADGDIMSNSTSTRVSLVDVGYNNARAMVHVRIGDLLGLAGPAIAGDAPTSNTNILNAYISGDGTLQIRRRVATSIVTMATTDPMDLAVNDIVAVCIEKVGSALTAWARNYRTGVLLRATAATTLQATSTYAGIVLASDAHRIRSFYCGPAS